MVDSNGDGLECGMNEKVVPEEYSMFTGIGGVYKSPGYHLAKVH